MTNKTRFGKAANFAVICVLLLCTYVVFAAVPTQTYFSDDVSYILGSLGINTTTTAGMLDIRDGSSDKSIYIAKTGANDVVYVTSSSVAEILDIRKTIGAGQTGGLIRAAQNSVNADREVIELIQSNVTAPIIKMTQNSNTCNIIVDADATCDAGTKIAENTSIAICLVCS